MRVVLVALCFLTAPACLGARVSQCAGNWLIENSRLRVTLTCADGRIDVRDKLAGFDWRQPGCARRKIDDVRAAGDGVSFKTNFTDSAAKSFPARVILTVPGEKPELHVKVDADANAAIADFDFIQPFIYQGRDGCLALTDWCSGHIYPTDIDQWPGYALDDFLVCLLQLPWVAVVDLGSGLGYSVTVDTQDDAMLRCVKFGSRRAPLIRWLPQMGKFGYPRELTYTFTKAGGYVALAKAYRSYANGLGAVVPFSEKAKTNPSIRKLFGAPLLWDYYHSIDAKEAYALGVTKALHHVSLWGHFYNYPHTDEVEDVRTENALGWLSEEYVQFSDAYEITPQHPTADNLYDRPNAFAWDSSGKPRLGWKDSNGQMTTRCSSFLAQRAREYMPGRLGAHSLTGIYLDVATQRELQECWNPAHPSTRSRYRADTVELMKYLRSLGLVVQGECGKWWTSPYQDVALGIASVLTNEPWIGVQPDTYGQTDYPGGKIAPDTWSKYETWGTLGHRQRVPLWELVFHDCTIATQRENDTADYCIRTKGLPFSYQRKKDALAILHGAMPTFYEICPPGSGGAWTSDRRAFLTSYRNVCKPNEVLGDKEMLEHRFLSADRDVQKTVWSDGTEVVCNFSEKAYMAKVRGKRYDLPPLGFAVNGPRIDASLALVDAKTVTRIVMDGYSFSDSQGVAVAIRRVNGREIRVNADYPGNGTISFSARPADVVPRWDLGRTEVWQCSPKTGERVRKLAWTREGDRIRLGPFGDWVVLDIVISQGD